MAANKGYKVLQKAMLEQDENDVDLKGYPVKGAKLTKGWTQPANSGITFLDMENRSASVIVTQKGFQHVLGTAVGFGVVSTNLGAILQAAHAHGEPDLLGLAKHIAPARTSMIAKIPKEDLVKCIDSKIDDLRILARELLKEAPT